MTVDDIQAMLNFFTLKTGRAITDGKVDVKFLRGDKARVKMSFLVHPKRDLKTLDSGQLPNAQTHTWARLDDSSLPNE